MRVRTLKASLVISMLAVAAAACSSGTHPTSNASAADTKARDSTGSRSDAASSIAPSALTAPGDTPAPVNVCSVMSPEAASAAAGRSFTSAVESDLATGVYSCNYTGDSLHWSITVYQRPSTQTLDDLLTDLGGPGTSQPVSGLGDKAYVSPVGVAAQFGDRYIEVGSPTNSASNEDGYESLAKAAIAALK